MSQNFERAAAAAMCTDVIGREKEQRLTRLNRPTIDRVREREGAVESKSFHRVGVVNKIYHNLFFSFSAFLSSLLRLSFFSSFACLLFTHSTSGRKSEMFSA